MSEDMVIAFCPCFLEGDHALTDLSALKHHTLLWTTSLPHLWEEWLKAAGLGWFERAPARSTTEAGPSGSPAPNRVGLVRTSIRPFHT